MRVLACVAVVAFLGCGSGAGDGADTGPLEEWAEAPETVPQDARRLEMDAMAVPAFSELQLCTYLDPEPVDEFLTSFDGYQAEGGHHVLLFRTVIPQAAGTVVDCTNPEQMATYIPVISQSALFPEGMAVRVSAGTQFVVQQHYVNTSDRDLLAHDVADIHFTAEGDVETLMGFYANTDVGLHIAPEGETSLTVRCTVPWDMHLVRMSPHMHEHGARFRTRIETGEDGDAQADAGAGTIVEIPTWLPAMRDIPPDVEWGRLDALELHAGDQVVTDCTWTNDTGAALGFPQEMCAVSGYYFPALEGQASWLCDGGENL